MPKKNIPTTQNLCFKNEHSRSLVRMAMLIESQTSDEKKQKKMSPIELLNLEQKVNAGIQNLWKTLENIFLEKETHIFEIKE